jgi:hypothetical protein
MGWQRFPGCLKKVQVRNRTFPTRLSVILLTIGIQGRVKNRQTQKRAAQEPPRQKKEGEVKRMTNTAALPICAALFLAGARAFAASSAAMLVDSDQRSAHWMTVFPNIVDLY